MDYRGLGILIVLVEPSTHRSMYSLVDSPRVIGRHVRFLVGVPIVHVSGRM